MMSEYQVEVSEVVDAQPERVYAIIADYKAGHPSILPQPYFKEMVVREGGFGSGTRATVRMEVFGASFEYDMQVTEPDPGHVLMEEDQAAGVQTTFTLEPVAAGSQTRVTIRTVTRTAAGVRGVVEKLINPPVTRKIYREELQQLVRVVEQRDH